MFFAKDWLRQLGLFALGRIDRPVISPVILAMTRATSLADAIKQSCHSVKCTDLIAALESLDTCRIRIGQIDGMVGNVQNAVRVRSFYHLRE